MDGTYVSIKFSNAAEFLKAFKHLGIQGLVEEKEIHVTIMYAEKQKFVEDVRPTLVGKDIVLENPSLQLFGEKKDTLVVEFKNELLTEENKRIMDEFGLKGTWSDYRPHITIKENATGTKVSQIILPKLPVMKVSEEKSEVVID